MDLLTLFLEHTVPPLLNFTTQNISLICSEHFLLGLAYMIYFYTMKLDGPNEVGINIKDSRWAGRYLDSTY
jgi:hypothetical protein